MIDRLEELLADLEHQRDEDMELNDAQQLLFEALLYVRGDAVCKPDVEY